MKFTDEQLAKIRETLAASGIPEEDVEFIVTDITSDKKEESTESKEENKQGDPTDPTEEENPADQTEEPSVESEEAPAEEQQGDPAPAEEPVVEELPPAAEEQALPPAEEVPPVEEPVADPAPAPAGYDDAELRQLISDLKGELEEANKTIEGQKARIDSLEEALKKGGFLDDSEAPVGDETPKAPAQVPVDDPMDDVLAQINGHKY